MHEKTLVSAKELSTWIGVTPRRIQQLVQEGVLPREARGEYLLKECVSRYVRYQDDQIMRTGASSDLSKEKLLAARLERRKKELEFEAMQGELVSVKDHEQAMAEAFAVVRSNLRNLPGALSPRLVGLDDARDVQAILLPALDDAMRSIVQSADSMIDRELPEDVPGRSRLVDFGVLHLSDLMAVDDLTSIHGIGPKTAQRIEEWRASL